MKFTAPQINLLVELSKLHTDTHLVGAPPDGRVRLGGYNRRTVNALVQKDCVAYLLDDNGEWYALSELGFDIAQDWIHRKVVNGEPIAGKKFDLTTHGTWITVRPRPTLRKTP